MPRRYPSRPDRRERHSHEETTFEPVPDGPDDGTWPERPTRQRRTRASYHPHGHRVPPGRGTERRTRPSAAHLGAGPRRPRSGPSQGPRKRALPVARRPARRPPPVAYDRPERATPPPASPRPPTGKAPFTTGTYMGLSGKVLYLIAIFLPWYIVLANVQAGDYSTDGWVEVVRIDGMKGVQINELLSGGGLPRPVSWLPVPLGWVLLFFFIWSVISIVRARTTRSRGWKLVRGGLVILIVFGIIYFMVARLASMVPEGSPDEIKDLVGYIVQAPLGGAATKTFGIYGSVDLTWGLEIGGYMLFFSGVLQLFGGFMEWGSRR